MESHKALYDAYLSRIPVVILSKKGEVYLDRRRVGDLKALPQRLEDAIRDAKCSRRIGLSAPADVPFEFVRKVLVEFRKSDVREVVFITRPVATYGEVWTRGKNTKLLKD